MEALLKELYTLFYEKSDPRYPGEHPGCDAVEEKIIECLSEMDDAELEKLLGGLSKKELYMINFPLEEIQDDHPCVEKYKQF